MANAVPKPFGTGLRACIGRPFAWQEALLVTALLLQNFNMALDDPNYQMRIQQALTIKPKDCYARATLRPGITALSLQETLVGVPGTAVVDKDVSEPPHTTEQTEVTTTTPLTILYGSIPSVW